MWLIWRRLLVPALLNDRELALVPASRDSSERASRSDSRACASPFMQRPRILAICRGRGEASVIDPVDLVNAASSPRSEELLGLAVSWQRDQSNHRPTASLCKPTPRSVPHCGTDMAAYRIRIGFLCIAPLSALATLFTSISLLASLEVENRL
jgi:hypothetical protein